MYYEYINKIIEDIYTEFGDNYGNELNKLLVKEQKENEVIDKIKEYTNTLLFELNRGKEFEKWEEILNPILELLEEVYGDTNK